MQLALIASSSNLLSGHGDENKCKCIRYPKWRVCVYLPIADRGSRIADCGLRLSRADWEATFGLSNAIRIGFVNARSEDKQTQLVIGQMEKERNKQDMAEDGCR